MWWNAKAFPLGGRWRGTRRMRGKCPIVAPSSVTCGDSFPQRGGSHIGGLPVRFRCRDGCNGRHICRPYKPTRKFVITVKSRAGRAPPLPRVFSMCPRRGHSLFIIYYLLSFIYFTGVPPASGRRRRRRPPHRRAGRLRQSAPAGGAAGSSSHPAGDLPPMPASGWGLFG